MKLVINNSLLSVENKSDIEFGFYKNYFIYNIENNIGNYIFIKKFINVFFILFKDKNYIYFFKNRKFKNFLINFEQSILSFFFGYFVELTLIGLGFKIVRSRRFQNINFELHYSHQIIYKIPIDIVIKTSKKNIIIFGLNKERVIDVANSIINLRITNIYKGKGIRYINQIIKLKPGKQR